MIPPRGLHIEKAIYSVQGTSGGSPIHIDQNVIADANNTSSTNLATPAFAFTGTKTSTLGVAGIQVSLYANKNCLVFVEQSPEGTNWDISDLFDYKSSTNFGITVQAVSSYYRVRVTTNAETTTTFRLQSCLCPIVEAVPRTLDVNGNLKVALQKDIFGNAIENSPNGEIQVVNKIRLVGTVFDGTTIDPSFWLTSVSTGTVAQANAQITITSGTANGHYARLYSVRRARFVSGSTPKFRCHLQLADTGTANVKRRWGVAYGASMPTITNGAYFELDGTTFSVVTMKTGNETRVSSGSFNGQLGYTYAPTTSDTIYEILLANGAVTFIVGGIPLHKVTASSTTWTDTLNFHIWADASNSGNSSAVAMNIRSINISRIGAWTTAPTTKYVAAAATTIMKYGPGVLNRMLINDGPAGSSITVYDNTSGAAPILTYINTAKVAAPTTLEMDFPFYTGLTVVSAGDVNFTTCYE